METKTYVIFSALYYPSIGGVENFTSNISSELVKRGYRVVVVTSSRNNPGVYTEGSVTVYRLPALMLLGGRLPLPILSRRFRQLWTELHELPCDGILINTRFYPHTLFGLHYANKKGITPIVLEHGSAYITLGSGMVDFALRIYENAITKIIKRYECAFYGVSEKCCDWLRHFGIVPEGVIPNGINMNEFRSLSSGISFRQKLSVDNDSLIVLFIGRLVPEKGVDSFVKAASNLVDQNARFVVAGDGPLRADLERRATDNVSFVGALNRPDVSSLLSQANLMCLPSRSEGFGAVLLEASAWAVPSCVTRVGAAEEIILSDEYGWLLDSMDPDELTMTIRRALSNKEELIHQGEKARDLVSRQFTWSASAESLLAAFKNASN